MEANQVEQFKQKLLTLKSELVSLNANLETETVELDQSRMGRLSRMDALQNQQLALEAKRRNERRLAAVEGALRRIEAGDFGYCYVCDEDIPAARLEADPTVTRCIKCVDA